MLRIRVKEWLYIMLFALILGFCISGFIASLYEEKIQPMLLMGVIVSFYVFVFSFITTELNNRWLIERVPKLLRTPFSLLLAFVSGFSGAMLGYLSDRVFKITSVELSFDKAISLSFFLGIITSSVGYLLYKLITLQRREEESRRLLLEEHIRNLEGQIAPHFMFNTLNAVAELVWQDAEKAEKSILSLARLLRRSLHLEPLITLEEEINLLKDYWSLMSLRFTGPIELQLDVDEKLLGITVPKFSLQILVENALKHGLKLKQGRVKVRAYSTDSKNILEVEDNGCGFNELKEGVGLSNLRYRLSLCGGKLTYSSQNGSTVFRIIL
ncbi:MAG: histidine kinase [Aquificaceae bacterium]|nr:histidine kinase [Aquificaceae bacterium]MDW8433949.1 histidine kinase [Aquificaceae bacterium]